MSIQYNSPTHRNETVQSGTWADRHNVFHDLIPFGYRNTSPLEVLRAFRDTYEEIGKYKQLFRMSHVHELTESTISPNQHRKLLYFAGTWDVKGQDTTNPVWYANPNYCHKTYPPIDEGQRKRLIQATYDIPFWTDRRLGQALGLHKSNAGRHRREVCGQFDGHSHDKQKWARTMKTIHSWGYTWREIGEVTPYSGATIKCQTQRFASDFDPPENPYNRNL